MDNNIEVLIKIPKKDYNYIKKIVKEEEYPLSKFYYNIANGIVLPKGHGDLKDVSNLLTVTDYDGEYEKTYVLYDEIKNAPTVIKANKAESENKG